MKRICIALLMLMPLMAFGASHTYTWDAYTPNDATIYVRCWLNTGTKTVVGSAPVTTAGVTFDPGDQAGDTVSCESWTARGSATSPVSTTASVTNGTPLAAPAGHLQ